MKRGHSKLYVRNNYFANIDEGSFVNDVAFARHDGAEAYGTVVTEGETEVMIWDWQKLREKLDSRPEMDRSMRFCFTQHLVKGLMQQREAAHLKHLKTGKQVIGHMHSRSSQKAVLQLNLLKLATLTTSGLTVSLHSTLKIYT